MCARALLLLGAAGAAAGACAPVQVQQSFNLTEWIRATWYVQRQQVNGYQPKDKLFCVAATYNSTNMGKPVKVPFFSGDVVAVFNDANDGKVNGPVAQNFSKPGFGPLCARVPDAGEPAKLLVAPCFLPNALGGDYWIVAAGPSADNYEWGLVSAGQPSVERDDGCTTPVECSGVSATKCGLWMFARKPIAEQATMDALAAAAKKAGISTDLLIDVPQAGCSYAGYAIKN
eukprot:TRINITY_DN47781_c0_g1_i1.p1 TRINITY_DN47781_c0_g1~~TRINITY_DN47781_c0_g1_i1.p1  ORF type:complete len:256 (+),score=112.27 TRINITY_DN47781_c0_g1_i1:79-768(+)